MAVKRFDSTSSSSSCHYWVVGCGGLTSAGRCLTSRGFRWSPTASPNTARAADLRAAIQRCVTDEEYIRLARDIEGVKKQLLERLGLRSVDLSPIERDLVSDVASVAESVPGVPKVSGLWMAGRRLGKQVSAAGSPVQRFLYREFVQAWKRTGC